MSPQGGHNTERCRAGLTEVSRTGDIHAGSPCRAGRARPRPRLAMTRTGSVAGGAAVRRSRYRFAAPCKRAGQRHGHEGLPPAPVRRLQGRRRRQPSGWPEGAPGAGTRRGRVGRLLARPRAPRLHRMRCRVHRRAMEGDQVRRLDCFPSEAPVSVRGLRPAVRGRPGPGLGCEPPAGGARPGVGAGRARAEDRLALAPAPLSRGIPPDQPRFSFWQGSARRIGWIRRRRHAMLEAIDARGRA